MRTPESDIVRQAFLTQLGVCLCEGLNIFAYTYLHYLHYFTSLSFLQDHFIVFYQQPHVGSSVTDRIWVWSEANFSRGNV